MPRIGKSFVHAVSDKNGNNTSSSPPAVQGNTHNAQLAQKQEVQESGIPRVVP